MRVVLARVAADYHTHARDRRSQLYWLSNCIPTGQFLERLLIGLDVLRQLWSPLRRDGGSALLADADL